MQAHGGGDRTERLDLEAIRRANEYRRKYLSDTDGDFVLGLVRGDNVCDVVDALCAEVERLQGFVDYLAAETNRLRTDPAVDPGIERLQSKNRELNRRWQEADGAYRDAKAIIDKHWDKPWCGGNLGRALLAYECSRLKAALAEIQDMTGDGDIRRVIDAALNPPSPSSTPERTDFPPPA